MVSVGHSACGAGEGAPPKYLGLEERPKMDLRSGSGSLDAGCWILDAGCPAFSGISASLQLALVN